MSISLTYSSFDPKEFRRKIEQNNKYSPVSQRRAPLAWLKDHVSTLDIGEHFANGEKPVHCNKNERVIQFFADRAAGKKAFLPFNWKQIDIVEHCARSRKRYFAGTGSNKQRFTLVLIDVDCKRYGSPEGARNYLESLRENFFPNLYIEESTNGQGGHGYFLLDKCDLGSKVLNDLLLHRLAPWLNELAQGFDVEFVEIKGTLPSIEWGEKKLEVLSYTAGTLAKVPVGLIDRFQELKNTTKVTAYDLQKLPDPEVTEKLSNQNNRAERKVARSCGSITGKHFDEEMLAGVQRGGRFWLVAEALMGCHDLRTSGRSVVTTEDMAIALMIGERLTKNMPANEAMPTKRWEGSWMSLFEAGDIDRGWDHKRLTVIRNFLSSLGLIDWEDEKYEPGWYRDDGTYVKGKAAKWRFSAELMQKLIEAGQDVAVTACEEGMEIDNREGEGHPLWKQEVTTITSWSQSLVQQSSNCTIRPVEVAAIRVELIDPGELMKSIDYFDIVAA